jgi:hypothetical protein
MAVIINDLEVVLDPAPGDPQPGGAKPVPEKPPMGPMDLCAVLDREQRNCLRLMAH